MKTILAILLLFVSISTYSQTTVTDPRDFTEIQLNDSVPQLDTIIDVKFEKIKIYFYVGVQEVRKIAEQEKQLTGQINNLKSIQEVIDKIEAVLKENENEFTNIVIKK